MINEESILKVMCEEHMTEKGDRVITGVSGGADSMCLLFLMYALKERLGISLEAVHVHHGIRGITADNDMALVEEQCKKLGIPLRTVKLDIPAIAEKEGLSEEEAGRIERYRIFEETGADRIAVAHHSEDSAETTLFNLFRGSGLKGLCGIRPVSGKIIRPLIYSTRQEIEEYCVDNNIPFRHDESNADVSLSRNRIRLNIIPEAEKINSAVLKHIAEASEKIKEARDYMEEQAEVIFKKSADTSELPEKLSLDLNEISAAAPVIKKLVLKKCIVLTAGREKDITGTHVSDVLALSDGESGKRLSLPYGIIAEKSFDRLVFSADEPDKTGISAGIEAEIPLEIIENGSESVTELPDGSVISACLTEKPENIPDLSCTKWFDYDKIKGTAVWRTRRTGDRISIQGGTKKLKELFIEKKIPAGERDRLFILTCGNDVIWAPGLRIGHGYKVTAATERVLKVNLAKGE